MNSGQYIVLPSVPAQQPLLLVSTAVVAAAACTIAVAAVDIADLVVAAADLVVSAVAASAVIIALVAAVAVVVAYNQCRREYIVLPMMWRGVVVVHRSRGCGGATAERRRRVFVPN